MPVARAQLRRLGGDTSRLVFVDDARSADSINGHAVLSPSDFFTAGATDRYAVIAIANGKIREQLANRCMENGVLPWTVSADNALTMDAVELGEGAVLSPFVTLTSNIRVGRHFHANLYSYVEHDCVIGDFVTFAPSVKCNGNVIIEDYAYVGAGAVIRQGCPAQPLVIGRGAIIGMGAVVTKSVPAGATVVGNPAKTITNGLKNA
jgi:sugar O-acyltransferase (sialic acid O-acetyltransferase NeuD family)